MATIKKTLRMYEFIKGYIASNSEPPTIAEIGKHFQMSSPGSVYLHLEKMKERGWITIIPNITRGIRLVEQEQNKAA